MLLTGVILLFASCTKAAPEEGARTGFDLSNVLVPREEIRSGGVPKDGIPAILDPVFIPTEKSGYLKDEDRILVFEKNGEARGYPLPILNRHELVNDQVTGEPFLVSYCPLCGTAMVFSRRIGGRTLTFGVSGLLYNSDVLMYDHQTESLWSQIGSRAIAGPQAGTDLAWLPSQQIKWSAWKSRYPHGKVLAAPGGSDRDYSQDPYAAYHASPSTMFPVAGHRKDLPQKARVLGVVVNGQAKAYPVEALAKAGEIRDEIGGKSVTVSYDETSDSATVTEEATGEALPQTFAYWFAWQAFHPKTLLFSGE